jgi:hypothetical protein
LQGLRQPPEVTPSERRQADPGREKLWATDLSHVEVDAALDSPGKRRVLAHALTEAERTCRVFEVEFHSFG